MLSKKQREVLFGKKGTQYERQGVRWLKRRGFKPLHEFKGPHGDYFDVEGQFKGKRWMIEIKGGGKPKIRIANLTRMYETRSVDKLGILFVLEKEPYMLFELSKMSLAGLLSSKTKGKAVERRAGTQAFVTRH